MRERTRVVLRYICAFLRTEFEGLVKMRKSRGRKVKRVALAYQLGAPHQERITHGILRYAEEHGPWEIVSSPEGSALSLEGLSGWGGDGIIAMLETGSQVELAGRLDIPIVNLTNSRRSSGFPTVASDQRAIGKIAAEHFLERNFRRFGFYGLKEVWYSHERFTGFRNRLQDEGFPVSLHETESSLLSREPWKQDRSKLEKWLGDLSCPAAIFTAHDYRARMVLESCRNLGIRVPDDIAVIGVDDDPIVCDFSRPSLTSIRQDGETVGRRAAALLDTMLNGGTVEEDILVAPGELIERDSTKITATESPALRQCLDLMEARHAELIDIAWLVAQLGISRRQLEKLFREELGKSPHVVLSEMRVERAKSLIRSETGMTFREIAEKSGFSEARRLSLVFQRLTGESPRQYRQQFPLAVLDK